MAATSEPRETGGIVYPETPSKPPPRLTTGIVAWAQENLFKSAFDTIVTIITALLLIVVTFGFFDWAIRQANWLVITRNLRIFMVGTFPAEYLWRVNLAALIVTFAFGFTVYAYLRVSRRLLAIGALLLASMVIIPIITYAVFPPTASYLTAGNTDVQSGTISETPQDQLAFIGRAGETVRVQIADLSGDQALAALSGFADRATAGMVNAASNRFETQSQIAELDAQLAGDSLTDRQRSAAEADRAALEVPPTVSDAYALNTLPVHVAVLDGASQAVLGEAVLIASADLMEVTLPADGWYVLSKVVEDAASEGADILQVTGIAPILERNLTNQDDYVRITDDFTVTNGRPEIDGDQLPFVVITDNNYRGSHTFADYMLLYASPMLMLMARGLIPLAIAGVIGGAAAWGVIRLRPKPMHSDSPKTAARGLIFPLWTLALIAFFVLIYGIEDLSFGNLMILLASFIWVGWLFFAGMILNRPYGRPLFGLLMVFGVVQSLVLTDGQPPANIVITIIVWLAVGYFAAQQGASARERFTMRDQVRGAIISSALWGGLVALALLGSLLITTPQNASGLLPVVETRRWGGLLLTMVLTAVALIASFPLGILLALGRRSSLPVVSGVCMAYIELVRGVPLITVLFMAQLLVPLVNPDLANVENAVRAMVGLTLFSAAYLAENVRGGLQSVDYGQEEAARALGLSTLRITMLITLPQALRAVIPALVGQCIALFKDTSLVALVGLLDLTGAAKAVTAQPEFVGLQPEAYLFISIIYFIFSYLLAFASRRIEASGSGAARRIG